MRNVEALLLLAFFGVRTADMSPTEDPLRSLFGGPERDKMVLSGLLGEGFYEDETTYTYKSPLFEQQNGMPVVVK